MRRRWAHMSLFQLGLVIVFDRNKDCPSPLQSTYQCCPSPPPKFILRLCVPPPKHTSKLVVPPSKVHSKVSVPNSKYKQSLSLPPPRYILRCPPSKVYTKAVRPPQQGYNFVFNPKTRQDKTSFVVEQPRQNKTNAPFNTHKLGLEP